MNGAVSKIEVKPARTQAERRAWMEVAYKLNQSDPAFVPPLKQMMLERIDPKHNAFFQHGEAELLIAVRDGEPVGRLSVQVNRLHLEKYQDRTGHFGFFECVDDIDVAQALLGAGEDWLRKRGLARVMGPFEFSINEECGLLVDGFDDPPAILMTHAARHLHRLLDGAGYQKSKDLLAFRIDMQAPFSATADRFLSIGGSNSKVKFRQLDPRRYEAEIETMISVYNDAWSDNWGSIPITDTQTALMAKSMKPLFVPQLGLFASVGDETVGTIAALPNLNEAIKDFSGRLLPFNWARLLWRLKVRGVESARVIILGIRKSHRRTILAPVIASGLIGRLIAGGRKLNLKWGELSWVLEDNDAMTHIGELLTGKAAKTYRIYAKDL